MNYSKLLLTIVFVDLFQPLIVSLDFQDYNVKKRNSNNYEHKTKPPNSKTITKPPQLYPFQISITFPATKWRKRTDVGENTKMSPLLNKLKLSVDICSGLGRIKCVKNCIFFL